MLDRKEKTRLRAECDRLNISAGGVGFDCSRAGEGWCDFINGLSLEESRYLLNYVNGLVD